MILFFLTFKKQKEFKPQNKASDDSYLDVHTQNINVLCCILMLFDTSLGELSLLPGVKINTLMRISVTNVYKFLSFVFIFYETKV